MARAIDKDKLITSMAWHDQQGMISSIDDVLDIIEAFPTLTPPNEWVAVEERLPEKDGWYLVYAPGYWGNSKIYGLDGLAYSNFKHNYKVHWGIERGTGRGWPGIVTHWTNLPAPPDRRPPEGESNA